LCTLRKVVGLTQDDLAQRVGVTRQSIWHIEKTKQMTWVTALAILMIFAYNSQSAKLLPILGILEIE
jgi:DNA-binding XRE family transcriptional regulator